MSQIRDKNNLLTCFVCISVLPSNSLVTVGELQFGKHPSEFSMTTQKLYFYLIGLIETPH